MGIKSRMVKGDKIHFFEFISNPYRKEISGNKYKATYVDVKCNCGSIKSVKLCHITSGSTKSCGCIIKINKTDRITEHGNSRHPLYRIWYLMKYRCFNEKSSSYKYYGGRGITVCDKWSEDYFAFSSWAINNGWKKGLEIDRKNVNGNYEPGNCRFVTRTENMRNIRNNTLSVSKVLAIRTLYLAKTHTQAELCDLFNIHSSRISSIINNKIWV